jgi:hypothetical protein
MLTPKLRLGISFSMSYTTLMQNEIDDLNKSDKYMTNQGWSYTTLMQNEIDELNKSDKYMTNQGWST